MSPVERMELHEIGPISRFLGLRWIVRTTSCAVLRTPWWLPRAVRDPALVKVAADYRVRYGSELRITSGPRLVRFEW
jgi:hypothetical protein